jgi:hypothetical protein
VKPGCPPTGQGRSSHWTARARKRSRWRKVVPPRGCLRAGVVTMTIPLTGGVRQSRPKRVRLL